MKRVAWFVGEQNEEGYWECHSAACETLAEAEAELLRVLPRIRAFIFKQTWEVVERPVMNG